MGIVWNGNRTFFWDRGLSMRYARLQSKERLNLACIISRGDILVLGCVSSKKARKDWSQEW